MANEHKHEVSRLPSSLDILDRKKLEERFDSVSPDVVFHCAALVSSTLCDFAGQSLSFRINVEGTGNVVKLCDEFGSKVVYLGTTASYKPTNGVITEDAPLEPKTLYGTTKLFGEGIARRSENSLILRLAYVFGPGDRASNIGALIRAYKANDVVILHASPGAKKDYLYIDDCAEALKTAIEKDLGGIYNISRMDPRSFSDVLRYLDEKGIRPIHYLRPEMDYLGTHVVSSEKFRRETGWEPRITIEEGIDRVLASEGLA